jgi:hypothetical protein
MLSVAGERYWELQRIFPPPGREETKTNREVISRTSRQ